ncbi:unnamed protein product [Prunus brigantina]
MTSLTSAKLCFLPHCLVILLYVSSPNWVAFPSATSTSDTEAKALLKWKANLFQNQSPNNLTWYDPPTHNINATNSSSNNPKPRTSPCTWTGVSCNSAGSVRKIDLSTCGIQVRLEHNQFTSNISEEFGVYPNLDFIDVSHNNWYGEISQNWQKCPKLTALRLAGNNLTGSIPPEIGNPTQIHVLDLSLNHLVGLIPKEFGRLSLLVKLMLNGNKLSGRIPLEFGSLNDLEYLDLSTNKLNGSIPSILVDLFRLHYLNLSNNKLAQAIPFKLGKLVQLNDLNLSHNSLEGKIPSEMGSMQSLGTLDLSHNNLSGSMPSSFEEMHGLSYVDISYNHLEGPLPNIRAFLEVLPERLKGNKGLCGKVGVLLPPCNAHGSKKDHKLIFSLLAVFVLVFAFFTIIFVIVQRKKKHQDTKQNHMHGEISFSVLNFDGKSMYEEIIRATEDFDSIYCIGKGGHGSVYRVNL